MRNPGPDNTLNNSEIEVLHRLETVAQAGLRSDTEVGEALAAIRDAQLYRGTHSTFEAYRRDRWGIDNVVPVRSEGSEAIANVYQQVLRALESSELTVADLRLTIHKVPMQSELPAPPSPNPASPASRHRGGAGDAQEAPRVRRLGRRVSGPARRGEFTPKHRHRA